MRRATVALLALILSGAAVAQIHGVPASVTSIAPGRSMAPGIPASVTSLGPNGFRGGITFGGQVSFGHNPRFDGRFDGRFHNRPIIAVPVYVPVYGAYYGGYPLVYQPHSIDDPIVAPGGVVQYGMSNSSRYEQPIYAAAPADDPRYGDHYLDGREDRRRARAQDADEQDDEQPSTPVIRPKSEAAAAPAPKQQPVEETVNAVLVYKDGHRREVRNYMIVGQTLWDLSDHLTRKIPLSDIDLDATTRLNDDRGTPINLPRS